MSTTNKVSSVHPHEPEQAPIYDPQGRCLVCSRLYWTAEAERWEGLAKQIERERDALVDVLITARWHWEECEHEGEGECCMEANRALVAVIPQDEDDGAECLGPEGDCVDSHVPPCPLAGIDPQMYSEEESDA